MHGGGGKMRRKGSERSARKREREREKGRESACRQAGKRVWYGLAARCREERVECRSRGSVPEPPSAPLSKMAATGRAEAVRPSRGPP